MIKTKIEVNSDFLDNIIDDIQKILIRIKQRIKQGILTENTIETRLIFCDIGRIDYHLQIQDTNKIIQEPEKENGKGFIELDGIKYYGGLLVDIYKSCNIDCSNKGASSRHETLLLVGKNIAQVFPITDLDKIGIIMKTGDIFNETSCVKYIIPYIYYKQQRWVMMGGCYATSSDTRIKDICKYPMPIYDRVEN